MWSIRSGSGDVEKKTAKGRLMIHRYRASRLIVKDMKGGRGYEISE